MTSTKPEIELIVQVKMTDFLLRNDQHRWIVNLQYHSFNSAVGEFTNEPDSPKYHISTTVKIKIRILLTQKEQNVNVTVIRWSVFGILLG